MASRRALAAFAASSFFSFLAWNYPVSAAPGDTIWVNVTASAGCAGDPLHGGEATGGPDLNETWCFEGGPADSVTVGPTGHVFTWRSYDARRLRDSNDSLYWHATTFHAPDGETDPALWCGGFNDRCGGWTRTTGGYANNWQQIAQLEIGPFSLAAGCSVQFRTQYVMECGYDYAYLEYYSHTSGKWKPIDGFNGKSGCTVIAKACDGDWNEYRQENACPILPWGGAINYPGDWRGASLAPRDFAAYSYAGGPGGDDFVVIPGDSVSEEGSDTIRLRWRVQTDGHLSSADGNSQVKGLWIDDVTVKGAGWSFTETFDALAEGEVPGTPWSFPNLETVYDGFAIRYDLDPPFEGFWQEGDPGSPYWCEANASWQWSIAPEAGEIPPPDESLRLPGFKMVLQSPAIPVDYADEEGGSFVHPGMVVQFDETSRISESNCEYPDVLVRAHLASAPAPYTSGAWCAWEDVNGFTTFTYDWQYFDAYETLTPWSNLPGVDSIQVAWVVMDLGGPDRDCWDPLHPPYVDDQYVLDNVSFGLFDAHATQFSSGTARSGRFQDTFSTHSCLHTANVATSELEDGSYVFTDASESLGVYATDPDGITEGNVRLFYAKSVGAADTTGWTDVAMNLTDPDPFDLGGHFTGTVCDTPWTAGTQIVYYVRAQDDEGNLAWFPAGADPSHPDYPDYFAVRILPTAGAKILVVDDNARAHPDLHACRSDTTLRDSHEFTTRALDGLGFEFMAAGGYDLYQVRFASSNQRSNEPAGFWDAPFADPSSGERVYDVVLWNTGPNLNSNTIQDTSQVFLKQFVFHGGKLLVTGDRILEDLTDSFTPVDPEFVPGVLGAALHPSEHHASAWLDPDRFPVALGVGPRLAGGDSLHLYASCEYVRPQMDKIVLEPSPPAWASPQAYMTYEDNTAPYDSLGGIYNVVTTAEGTGAVVYLPWSFDAVVDWHEVTCNPPVSIPPWAPGGGEDVPLVHVFGRAELLRDILELFGCSTSTSVAGGTLPGVAAPRYANALLAPQPNPLNPETTVQLTLAEATRVRLVVYDVQGRRVRTLLDERREAGVHALRWDGRTDGGRDVSSGIYFVRMETEGGFQATQKLTLLE